MIYTWNWLFQKNEQTTKHYALFRCHLLFHTCSPSVPESSPDCASHLVIMSPSLFRFVTVAQIFSHLLMTLAMPRAAGSVPRSMPPSLVGWMFFSSSDRENGCLGKSPTEINPYSHRTGSGYNDHRHHWYQLCHLVKEVVSRLTHQ